MGAYVFGHRVLGYLRKGERVSSVTSRPFLSTDSTATGETSAPWRTTNRRIGNLRRSESRCAWGHRRRLKLRNVRQSCKGHSFVMRA
jgi:hypothetical protein